MGMHAKYEVSISYCSKVVIAKVKVDNRQTDRQSNKWTDRQDKNNMPPIIQSWEKIFSPFCVALCCFLDVE